MIGLGSDKNLLLVSNKISYNMPICLTIKSAIEDDIEEETHDFCNNGALVMTFFPRKLK